jgi:hypothetical protein
MKNVILVMLVALAGWYGYAEYQRRAQTPVLDQALEAPVAPAGNLPAEPISSQGRFSCDGRIYCSQMTSCAEATYFLRNCPGTKMDGDHDGIPCESQWCK